MAFACRIPVISALFATALLVPPAAEAANRSVYVDIRSCPSESRNGEEEVIYCRGPGGTMAVLANYITGVGLAFDMGQGVVPAISYGIALSPSGGPFGKKLEWRMKPGARKPCAAILRVYAEPGQRLTVTDLASGQMVGMVRTNDEAQALADDLCR